MSENSTFLQDAYAALGVDESADEEAVSVALIERLSQICESGRPDMRAQIYELICAEDTICCFKLDTKYPGALEAQGYTPETREAPMRKLAENYATAFQSNHGPVMMAELMKTVEAYKKLQTNEDLPPSLLERQFAKTNLRMPKGLGQSLSRAVNPTARKALTQNLLAQTRLYEQIIMGLYNIEEYGEGLRSDGMTNDHEPS